MMRTHQLNVYSECKRVFVGIEFSQGKNEPKKYWSPIV